MNETERRTSDGIEAREVLPDTPGSDVLEGYAALFDTETTIAGLFREVVRPGAFREAVASDDVRALYNHDPSQVLGRTRAGTLTLAEDARGLRYQITLPNTTMARDLLTSVRRGDVTQSSYAFRVPEGGERWERSAGQLPLRVITRAELFDVSPVTYPATDATSVSARARDEAVADVVEVPRDETRRKRWLAALAESAASDQ